MNEQAIEYYAKKFFPHLLLSHAVQLIKELLEIERRKQIKP